MITKQLKNKRRVYGALVLLCLPFLFVGCMRPNATIALATTKLKQADSQTFQDLKNALNVIEEDYWRTVKLLYKREFTTTLKDKAQDGKVNLQDVEEAFKQYQDAIKEFENKLDAFREKVKQAGVNHYIAQRLGDAIIDYHSRRGITAEHISAALEALEESLPQLFLESTPSDKKTTPTCPECGTR